MHNRRPINDVVIGAVDTAGARIGVSVGSAADETSLRSLLTELHAEECAHSWKNVPSDMGLEALNEYENAHRPTALFFYHAVGDGCARDLIGAASVADKVSPIFPHSGFPVLARCYIRRRWRGKGLYRRILRHRLEFCKGRFGNQLTAVHIGTSDAGVMACIAKPVDEWPPFTDIGRESLRMGNEVRLVRGYLLFSTGYRRALYKFLGDTADQRGQDRLKKAIERMLSGAETSAPDHYNAIAHILESFSGPHRAEQRTILPLRQFIDMCEAIPLVKYDRAPVEPPYSSQGHGSIGPETTIEHDIGRVRKGPS